MCTDIVKCDEVDGADHAVGYAGMCSIGYRTVGGDRHSGSVFLPSRTLDIEWLVGQRGIVALAGDSGIGKTTLLGSIHSTAGTSTVGPYVSAASPGSLQRSLLDGVAAAIDEQLGRDEPVRRARAMLLRTRDRLKAVALLEARHAVTTLILSALRARLGDEIADAAKRLAKEFRDADSPSIIERLKTARPADVVEELQVLLREVDHLIDRDVLILVDQAERLSATDQSLLLDLAKRDLGGVLVVVALNTGDARGAELLGMLRTDGIPDRFLEPISLDEIVRWCVEEELSPAIAVEVARVSNGYPFFVREAIDLAQRGGAVGDVQGGASFLALLKERWKRTSISTRDAALRLSALEERPPDEFLASYLGIDVVQWSLLEGELIDSSLFLTGQSQLGAWFHDRRRKFLWDDLLSGAGRRAATADLARSLLESFEHAEAVDHWAVGLLLVLRRENGQVFDGDDRVPAWVQELGRSEYAILFGLLELVEPRGEMQGFVETSLLARYVLSQLGPLDDLADSLDRLQKSTLTLSVSQGHVSITTILHLGSVGLAFVLSSIVREFGRWPIPRVASTLFTAVIAPRVGPFWRASYGIGTESLARQAGFAREQQRKERDFSGPRHSLVISASVSSRTFSSVVIFNDAATRDQARVLLAQLPPLLAGEALAISSLDSVPQLPVRSRRVAALIDLDARLGEKRRVLNTQAAWTSQLLQRMLAFNALLGRLSPLEARIVNCAPSVGVLVAFPPEGGGHLSMWFRTSAPRVETFSLEEVGSSGFADPLLEVRLADAGKLRPGESSIRQQAKFQSGDESSEPSPLEWLREFIDEPLGRFNQLQMPRVLTGGLDRLQQELTNARKQALGDYRALHELAEFDKHRLLALGNQQLRIELQQREESESIQPFGQSASWFETARAETQPLVSVTCRPLASTDATGVPGSALKVDHRAEGCRSGRGIASFLLARWCGFEPSSFYCDVIES